MNSSLDTTSGDPTAMTRREAIQRTALLLGMTLSPALLSGVLRAQTTKAANGKAAYLNPRQLATAGAIAEQILPRTDTPGASDVGVPAFLDLMYGEYMTPDEQRTFATGLAEVDQAAHSTRQRDFSQLAPAQQETILKQIAEASQALEKTFFHQFKELTLLGYFTSEEIGKNVLHYDPIPGKYQGCIPLADVGNKSWTR